MTMFSGRQAYTQAEREFFAQWTETRARVRPALCHDAEIDCWVKEGPPAAFKKNTQCCCKACGGHPKLRL
jgi:hypothetical protein